MVGNEIRFIEPSYLTDGFFVKKEIIMGYDTRIKIDEGTLDYIIKQESIKLVGTCLKRIEIPLEIKEKTGEKLVLNKKELENVKSQQKNLIYESLRALRDMIRINGKEPINLTIKK